MTTSSSPLDVVCTGNAIVDVLVRTDDAFLTEHGLAKGAMMLIDADRAEQLYGLMGCTVERSGGSVANSAAGIGALGGRCAYIGKVAKDQLGDIFARDMRSLGIEFDTARLEGGAPTARSFIFVTPDAERTMQTFLGACTELTPDDIDPALVSRARYAYLEAYLWDKPQAKAAVRRTAEIARAADRKVALSLSDSFCVDRHRDEFRSLIGETVDIVFANDAEIRSLVEVDDLDQALAVARGMAELIVVTKGAAGCVVLAGDQIIEVPAEQVDSVVDTTGAGDMFAAGFLSGLVQDRPLAIAARIGCICAGEVLRSIGPRGDASLKDVVAARLGDG